MRFGRLRFALAGVSLLACITLTVVAVRSYWIGHQVGKEWCRFTDISMKRHIVAVRTGRGGLAVDYSFERYPRLDDSTMKWFRKVYDRDGRFRGHIPTPGYPQGMPLSQPEPNVAGFAWRHWQLWSNTERNDRELLDIRSVVFPAWLPVILLGLYPARFAVLFRRERRRGRRAATGLCESCGYDLRASPGRCPECGRKVVTPPAAGCPALGDTPTPADPSRAAR